MSRTDKPFPSSKSGQKINRRQEGNFQSYDCFAFLLTAIYFRDLGEHLRKFVAKEFPQGEASPERRDEAVAKQFASLERLAKARLHLSGRLEGRTKKAGNVL